MYENWKRGVGRSPNTIKLDVKNPRLHDVPKRVSQRALANITLSQYSKSVRKIAKSIVEKGYFPHEDIITIMDNNTLTVVEGNCRLCACKILLNPKIVDDKVEQKHFSNLSSRLTERVKGSFKKISCTVAPTREEAYILIESRHTGAPINPWTPYAQGNFYRTLIAEGKVIEELAEEFNRSASDIRNMIRVTSLTDILMHLPNLSERIGKDVSQDVKKIGEAARNILRLLLSEEAKKFFGHSMFVHGDGALEFNLSEEDVVGLLSSLIDDALLRKDAEEKPLIDSRSLNDHRDRNRYLSKYDGYKPKGVVLEGQKRFNSKNFLSKAFVITPDVKEESKVATVKKKTKKDSDQWLLKRDLDCHLKSSKIKELVKEAKALKWESTVLTSGLLLRAIIECALKNRFKKVEKWDQLLKANKSNPIIGLDLLLKETINHKEILDDDDLNAAFQSDFRHLSGRYKKVLDFIQHNEMHLATKEDIKEIRTKMEPLIQQLIEVIPLRDHS